MPAGRSLLLPVLNCEANSLEYPELKTHGDLIEHVTRDLNSVVKKVCMINGMSLTPGESNGGSSHIFCNFR